MKEKRLKDQFEKPKKSFAALEIKFNYQLKINITDKLIPYHQRFDILMIRDFHLKFNYRNSGIGLTTCFSNYHEISQYI